MLALLVKHPDRASDLFPLGRLLCVTIGRSARNDVCIPDPFASRVHAEVRLGEADQYLLQDLGSANGTFYNGEPVAAQVVLAPGGCIQIGQTVIEFSGGRELMLGLPATMITDTHALLAPEATISVESVNRTTSGLLKAIESARLDSESGGRGRVADETHLPGRGGDDGGGGAAQKSDLLALIGKVGVTLLASATLDETLQQVAALVFEAVPAERCLIMLRDEEKGEELRVRVANQHKGQYKGQYKEQHSDQFNNQHTSTDAKPHLAEEPSAIDNMRISSAVIEEVVDQGKSILTSDAQQDPRFTNTMILDGIRSVLAVPLGVGCKIFGLIYADSPLAEVRFTEDHLKVLTTLASVAAIRVENTKLLETQLERNRLEHELQLAREIQQRFQPAAAPLVPGYELLGISFPCHEIGGDYYDFIERADDRVVIALGDVSGKGTPAALLMSSLHAAIHAQVASHYSLSETITAVNKYLARNIPPNRFVTLFYAELDPVTGALVFLNAGHNPPLLIHTASGTVEHLAAGGIPLGIKENAAFREGRTQLQPGDVMVIYSDGVSETTNPQGEEFGVERLYEVIAHARPDASAATLRDQVEAALTKFARGTPAADDITLIIVKRQMTSDYSSRINAGASNTISS